MSQVDYLHFLNNIFWILIQVILMYWLINIIIANILYKVIRFRFIFFFFIKFVFVIYDYYKNFFLYIFKKKNKFLIINLT